MLSNLDQKDRPLIYSIIKKEFNINYKKDSIYTNWFVYKDNDNIIGFINYDIIFDKAEIEYIYVVDEYKKKGIGTKLLNKMIEDLKENNVDSITLEVRSNNDKAIKFYKKNGFNEVARRPNYYGNVDALLMLRSW